MAQDDTYQVDVYKQRPGDTHHIGSDGELTVWSGGELLGNSLGYLSFSLMIELSLLLECSII